MFQELEHTLTRLYPTRTWGQPDDAARFEAGISEEDGQALAEELAVELKAATFYRPGEPDEYCDYIYVLCLGREPCLVQIRDGEVPLPDEIMGAGQESSRMAGRAARNAGQPVDSEVLVSEQYLRVCLSHMARVAGVQQVAMELHRSGGDYLVHEMPRSGVYDAPFLRRFQRLVALLPAYDILHLDFGEISAPPAGFNPGEYGNLYGGEPHTANYLFYPQPSTMKTTSLILG